MNCKCGGTYKLKFIASKNDLKHEVYACDKCDHEIAAVHYKYNPTTCPGHQWEFKSWGFADNGNSHEIYWNLACDRCGKIAKKRFDSYEVGLRNAVTMDDPRVLKTLELTKDTARFHLPPDDIAEFWK